MDDWTFDFEGECYSLTPELIAMLHNWNFGTSLKWYKNPEKNIILPNVAGKLVRITNVEKALEAAISAYDTKANIEFERQNSI